MPQPECAYEKVYTDWVPYGSTNVPMYSSDCQYEGDIDIENAECGRNCPAFKEAPTRADYKGV